MTLTSVSLSSICTAQNDIESSADWTAWSGTAAPPSIVAAPTPVNEWVSQLLMRNTPPCDSFIPYIKVSKCCFFHKQYLLVNQNLLLLNTSHSTPMTRSAHKGTPRRAAFNKVSHSRHRISVQNFWPYSPLVRPTKSSPGRNSFPWGFRKNYPAFRHQGQY